MRTAVCGTGGDEDSSSRGMSRALATGKVCVAMADKGPAEPAGIPWTLEVWTIAG